MIIALKKAPKTIDNKVFSMMKKKNKMPVPIEKALLPF